MLWGSKGSLKRRHILKCRVYFRSIQVLKTVRGSGSDIPFTIFTGRGREDVVIAVEDDGIGVPAEMKELIFKRGVGSNTGYGLFRIHEILGITGMSIRECGVEGKGACFEITVPHDAWRMRDYLPGFQGSALRTYVWHPLSFFRELSISPAQPVYPQ